jgi:hypothetical protein
VDEVSFSLAAVTVADSQNGQLDGTLTGSLEVVGSVDRNGCGGAMNRELNDTVTSNV